MELSEPMCFLVASESVSQEPPGFEQFSKNPQGFFPWLTANKIKIISVK